jgi:hypothetical protein
LEDEDDADARVEAAEVCGHSWEAEGRPFDAVRIGSSILVFGLVFHRYDLLEQPS